MRERGGCRHTAEIKRLKLDGFTGFIDQWLLEGLSANRKQRHTAKRVFERPASSLIGNAMRF